MNSKFALKKLEQSLEDIRSLTRVFEHAAARKMEVNMKEIDKLNKHLTEARESYSYAKISIAEKHKDADAILRTAYRVPTKRKVLILVSSESRYVGSLLDSMVRQFMAEFGRGNCDGIVVGQSGKNLLAKYKFKAAGVVYFDFDDDKPDWNVVSRVSEQLGNYLEIVIFWGKYKSILTQELEREDIAKSVLVETVPKRKKYDFEAHANVPLALLEKQMIASAFLEKLFETGLTKNAVRVKILEIGAIAERISAAFDMLAKYKVRYTKDSNNRKQTQLYGSRSTWEKRGMFSFGR